MFLPDPCRSRCAARHLRTSLDFGRATASWPVADGVPMMVRQRTEAGVAAFRTETRTMRLERLHGPKEGHSGPRVLSPDEREKLRQEALEERERYRRERSIKDGSPEGR